MLSLSIAGYFSFSFLLVSFSFVSTGFSREGGGVSGGGVLSSFDNFGVSGSESSQLKSATENIN